MSTCKNCGELLVCKHCGSAAVKVRSPADHRRFFAMIAAAYSHWREAHEFTPDSPEHLRKWLLCKAGYRESTEIAADITEDQPALAKLIALTIESALKAANSSAFVRVYGDRVAVHAAKSIAFDKLDQKKFGQIREAVEQIIGEELGVPTDELLKEHERAA